MDAFVKVKHVEYLKLLERVKTLEKENATLKADLKKATAKSEKEEVKTETKKGGNK